MSAKETLGAAIGLFMLMMLPILLGYCQYRVAG